MLTFRDWFWDQIIYTKWFEIGFARKELSDKMMCIDFIYWRI